MEPHPAQLLIVSPEMLRKHLIAFEREINSKRLQSKIKSIGDLIIVLYKRNVINGSNYANVLQNVLNDFTSFSDKVKIKDFVQLLDRHSDCSGINVNQYGEFEFMREVECADEFYLEIEFGFSSSEAESCQIGEYSLSSDRCSYSQVRL